MHTLTHTHHAPPQQLTPFIPTPKPRAGDINETVIKETAQLLVDTGLRDAGYIYLNLCVCFYKFLCVPPDLCSGLCAHN